MHRHLPLSFSYRHDVSAHAARPTPPLTLLLITAVVYGTSNILSDFCDTFDSNGNAVGLPCL